jgi:DNA ligase-associated metallophosphoesterase
MATVFINIRFGGEELLLLADRAVHWPARETLILADVHLGKDAAFRVAGMPVPAGNSSKDLARIDALLNLTRATRLVVLGDLVHNRRSHQRELAAAFMAWREVHPKLEILLIRGNHDRHAGPPPADWGIVQVEEPFDDGPLSYAHFPQEHDRPLLCGHVHPIVAVKDFARTFVSLPCFVVEEKLMTLPAFGSFTGGFKVDRDPCRKIFAVIGQSVVQAR